MGYGSAAEDEHMLSYSPKEVMATAPVPASTSLPSSLQTAADSPDSPPSLDPPAAAPPLTSLTTSRVVPYARQTWRDCRPWPEFYSTRAISRPAFADLSDRFASNLHVYRGNYQVIAAFWLALMLLGNLQSLLLAGGLFWVLDKVVGHRMQRNEGVLSHKHKVLIAVAVLSIVWVTHIGTYAVRSLLMSGLSIAAHASLHEPEAVETEIASV